MQLPYDRCVKIDQEVDTLLEEEKKKFEDSKKSRHFAVYKWLGWNLMLEYVCGKILEAILVVPFLYFSYTVQTRTYAKR